MGDLVPEYAFRPLFYRVFGYSEGLKACPGFTGLLCRGRSEGLGVGSLVRVLSFRV